MQLTSTLEDDRKAQSLCLATIIGLQGYIVQRRTELQSRCMRLPAKLLVYHHRRNESRNGRLEGTYTLLRPHEVPSQANLETFGHNRNEEDRDPGELYGQTRSDSEMQKKLGSMAHVE